MPRVLKPVEHTQRRDTFLDAAQHLVQTKGYERMTVQDVLDEVETSKGAFYHYFDSKQALLEALIDRMSREVEATLSPPAYDPGLPALDKLGRVFSALAGWKTARREILLALVPVWYSDENAVVRQKTRAAIAARVTPLLAAIIAQGVGEGVLATPYPDAGASVVVALIQELNDALGRLLLESDQGSDTPRLAEHTVAAYGDALERILGAPSHSLPLADAATLQAWFTPEEDTKP
jgi:AcrR family transcriptional regulator